MAVQPSAEFNLHRVSRVLSIAGPASIAYIKFHKLTIATTLSKTTICRQWPHVFTLERNQISDYSIFPKQFKFFAGLLLLQYQY